MFNYRGYHLGLYIECKNTVLFEKNRIWKHFSKKQSKILLKERRLKGQNCFINPLFYLLSGRIQFYGSEI